MATVYLADDLRHERKVALKVLKPELAAVVGAERFLAEIKTTANLQHPHILPLFDSGEADGFLFYVMPFVEGETLRGRIERERQLAVEEAVAIGRKVADALDYAHERGVVHRDIKPANILLSDRGEPLVADFGIALAVAQAGGGRITETGLSLGTPHYMSPEQATGERDIDPRSDVYALGCVLYEMLAGDPPFSGSSAQGVLVKILTSDAPSVTEARRTVPQHVAGAVAKALEKLPADRFATARAFADALTDAGFAYRAPLRESGHHAEHDGARARTGRTLRRPWITDLRSVASLVALALLAAWGLLARSEPPPMPVLRLDLDTDGVSFDPRRDLEISPDGGTLVGVGSRSREGGQPERGLFIRTSRDPEFRYVSGTEDAWLPSVSPDGAWIAYSREGRLMRLSTAGGAPTTVAALEGLTRTSQPGWVGDDRIWVMVGGESGTALLEVPAAGGTPDTLWTGRPEETFTFLRPLPGGRGALGTRMGSRQVVLWTPGEDSPRILIDEALDAAYVSTGHILHAHPSGGLFAVAFDLDELELVGTSVPVVDDLSHFRFSDTGPIWPRYSVSSRGTLVYAAGAATVESPELPLVVDLETGTSSSLLTPRDFTFPSWSPDGRRIAFVSEGNVYAYDVELGTVPRQLSFDGRNTNPIWSPDGSRVAFTSQGDISSTSSISLKSVIDDRPEEQLLTFTEDLHLRDWSRDDVLAFEVGRSPTRLARADLSAGERVVIPYLESEADLDDIVISPDGRWAAYQSTESGTGEEIYVRSFPDPGQRIPISDGSGQFPRWAPDGSAIYYWGGEFAIVDTLYRADLDIEPTLSVRSREPVLIGEPGSRFLTEHWDLHPDGDRIVVSRSADGSPRLLQNYSVIVNFFDELRARMPR